MPRFCCVSAGFRPHFAAVTQPQNNTKRASAARRTTNVGPRRPPVQRGRSAVPVAAVDPRHRAASVGVGYGGGSIGRRGVVVRVHARAAWVDSGRQPERAQARAVPPAITPRPPVPDPTTASLDTAGPVCRRAGRCWTLLRPGCMPVRAWPGHLEQSERAGAASSPTQRAARTVPPAIARPSCPPSPMLQLAVDWAGVATMASTTRRVLEDIWDTTTTTLGATAAAAYGRVGQVVGVGGGIDAVSEHYTVDRVWPHAQKQHGQADVMLQRLQGWQAIIGGLTAYFDGNRSRGSARERGSGSRSVLTGRTLYPLGVRRGPRARPRGDALRPIAAAASGHAGARPHRLRCAEAQADAARAAGHVSSRNRRGGLLSPWAAQPRCRRA